mmetsp:Transcript_81085/g.161200  ORF Transcript_81085/g.161200 Transcript_81085/m.161200 type:complete len:253 (-) Transcript_81085:306-1064(-)
MIDALTYHLSNMPLAGSIGYLGVIYLLHSFMSSRSAVHIPKQVMVLYNVMQVVINGYVAYAIAAPLGGWVFGIGLPDSPALRHGVWLHYLCKYMDMIDTTIIALRKKSDQLSFLHLYHHATIVVVWGWVVNTWPIATEGGSGAYAYGAWINSCVHVIMYGYYGVAALGVKVPQLIKKSVTTVQLSQFASCIMHAFAALAFDTTPIFYNITQVLYHIGMLYLFLPLLLRGYKPRETKAAASAVATPETVKKES